MQLLSISHYNNRVQIAINTMMDEKQDSDLEMPLTNTNKFVQFIFRNKSIDRLAYRPTIVCLALGFLVFFTLAIYMFVAMAPIQTITTQYFSQGGTSCQTLGNCTITFNLTTTMQPPIYLLYQLDNFHQNQRLFYQSKNNKQLMGKVISQSEATFCSPYITNSQMKVTQSWANVTLDPNAVASPCGSIAYAFFNDTFSLSSNSMQIPIDQTGISWPGDKGGKYNGPPDSASTQWINPQNEHFIVWMRTAGLDNFKKLWGRIHQPLFSGQYQMTIANNYRLSGWNGGKYFVLSTLSPAGGQNYLLPIEMLIVSLGCLAALIYLIQRAMMYQKLRRAD